MFYLEFFQRLEKSQVRYLLVGGLAMNLHGVPRMTMDVDIVLAMDHGNVRAFVDMAKEMGLYPVAPIALESLFDPSLLRKWKQEKGMIAFAPKGRDAGAPICRRAYRCARRFRECHAASGYTTITEHPHTACVHR